MKKFFITFLLLFSFLYVYSQERSLGVYKLDCSDFLIFPNYRTGILKLITLKKDTLTVLVYNQVLKKEMFKQTFYNKDTIEIPFMNYKSDSYLLKITKPDKSVVIKKYLSVSP